MPLYHVYAFEHDTHGRKTGHSHLWLNIPEEHLRDRLVAGWDSGDALTYDGETVDSTRTTLRIFETDEAVEHVPGENS